MASKLQRQVMCDIHLEKKAEAMCMKHHELLCITCIVDKARSGDCKEHIEELGDSPDEKQACILEHLSARQTVKQLDQTHAEHFEMAKGIKEKLLKEVRELHEHCVTRLNEKLAACENDINTNAENIEKAIVDERECLNKYRTEIDNNLEKLKEEDGNWKECTILFKEIQENVTQKGNEKMSEPESLFKPNEKLKTCIDSQGLGVVSFIHQKHYADVGGPDIPQGVDGSDSADNGALTGSDTYSYATTGSTDLRQNSDEGDTSKMAQQIQESPQQIQESPKDKKGKGFFAFLKRGKSGDKEAPSSTKPAVPERSHSFSVQVKAQVDPYDEVTLPEPRSFDLKKLVNTKVGIPSFDHSSNSPVKFTKIVHLGEGIVGLLADTTVFVTEFPNGPTMRKKFGKPIDNIASVGSGKMAVLTGQQITVLGIECGKLSGQGSCFVQASISGVTGFQFNSDSSMYAISTITKVYLLDKNGKTLKEIGVSENDQNASNYKSVYDFGTQHVLYMNIMTRGLKCLNCTKDNAVVVWKKKCGEDTFKPRDICLFKDQFCVASPKSIAIFTKTTGVPVANHEIYDILDDCLSVSATEGVVMWTSNVDDTALATSIGFVGI